MNQPERFKTAWASEPAGRLMISGGQEKPGPQALHRAARRLGISAATLASAAATAVATEASAAVSSTVADGVVLAGTVVGKTAGSLLAASVIKGTLIGLGITIAAYSGVQWMPPGTPSSATVSTSIREQSSQQPQLKVTEPSDIPTPSVRQEPEPTPLKAQPAAASSGSATAKALVVIQPRAITAPPTANAAPTVRFEDPEPPALPPIQQPGTTNGTASVGPVSAAGTPSSRRVPSELRLMREVASLDRARALANRGNAASALRELNSFEHDFGFVTLRKEAMLVTIDALLSLGRKAEAITFARRLLALGAPATQRAKLEALVSKQQ